MKTTSLRLVGAFVVTGLIGLLDYYTGDELDLFVLYFVPIAWAAWTIGRQSALGLAFFSGVLWLSANVVLGHAYSQPLLGAWGELVMMATFVATALATHRIRRLLDHERELNTQLNAAMAKVKKLSGRLPICMACKNIQDDVGAWLGIEEYFTHQSEDDFVFKQTICPHCSAEKSNRSPQSSPPAAVQLGAR